MANSGSRKPHFFMDLGRQAKDLLQKGFSTGHMLLVSYVTASGATLSTSAIMMQDFMVGTLSSSFVNAGVKTDLSASTLNEITAGTTYEDLTPGLKVSLTTTIPDGSNLGKAELVYQHDSAAITATVKGFKTTPILECSANFGYENMCFGGSFVYDSASNSLMNTVAGLGYTAPQMSAALTYSPIGRGFMQAYYSQEVNSNILWGTQIDYQVEKRASTATTGGLYKVNSQTTIKARVNNDGIVSALLEYEPKPLVTVGLCAEVNTRSLKTEKPIIGFSLSVISV